MTFCTVNTVKGIRELTQCVLIDKALTWPWLRYRLVCNSAVRCSNIRYCLTEACEDSIDDVVVKEGLCFL